MNDIQATVLEVNPDRGTVTLKFDHDYGKPPAMWSDMTYTVTPQRITSRVYGTAPLGVADLTLADLTAGDVVFYTWGRFGDGAVCGLEVITIKTICLLGWVAGDEIVPYDPGNPDTVYVRFSLRGIRHTLPVSDPRTVTGSVRDMPLLRIEAVVRVGRTADPQAIVAVVGHQDMPRNVEHGQPFVIHGVRTDIEGGIITGTINEVPAAFPVRMLYAWDAFTGDLMPVPSGAVHAGMTASVHTEYSKDVPATGCIIWPF